MMDILEQDLLIFSGFRKVLFDSFSYGDEQEVLYCDIDDIITSFSKQGNKYNEVSGLLSFVCPMGKTKYDILLENYELCDKTKLGGILNLTPTTQTLRYSTGGSRYAGNKYGSYFLKVSNSFTYILDYDFNKIRKKITSLSINVREK
ncbi:MAG: hypothetical protein LBS34_00320 [Rickettsiales bacterium]|jgi:hypothetical protein|nr:hypothetical protein [Rickettsiales bacterium]